MINNINVILLFLLIKITKTSQNSKKLGLLNQIEDEPSSDEESEINETYYEETDILITMSDITEYYLIIFQCYFSHNQLYLFSESRFL